MGFKSVGIAICVLLLCQTRVMADEIDKILPYLIQVESGGHEDAVSPAAAVGLCQITPIVICEWNMNNDTKLTIDDMYDGEKNKMVAKWYLRRLRDVYLKHEMLAPVERSLGTKVRDVNMAEQFPYSVIDLIENAEDRDLCLVLAAYNGGITRLRKNGYSLKAMPRETKNYVVKIMTLYKEDYAGE